MLNKGKHAIKMMNDVNYLHKIKKPSAQIHVPSGENVFPGFSIWKVLILSLEKLAEYFYPIYL